MLWFLGNLGEVGGDVLCFSLAAKLMLIWLFPSTTFVSFGYALLLGMV